MKINFNNFNVNTLAPKTDFEKEVCSFIMEWFSESETIEVKTSGSTGVPKTLQIEKDKMRNSAKMTCDFFDFKEGNTALLCLPVVYISGKMMVVRAIERKMVLTVGNPSSKPLENLKEKIDFCAMTPLQVENSLDHIYIIKNLIIGGAKVSESLKQKIFKTLKNSNSNNTIFETYGMSETLSHIALKKIYPEAENYFTVLDSIEISKNQQHCLQIKAPKLTSEMLQTHDIVKIIDDNHFQFIGRADFVINSGGAKIFPEELENYVKKELSQFGIENELIFTGLQDAILGEKLVLMVEGQEHENVLQKISEIKFEKKFHQPKEILFIEKFPRSENGKILRKDILSKK